MPLFHKNTTTPFIILLIFVGAFLRFYNFNWGAPFYFHPDERNIAYAVTQLSFPEKMDPHFFAYGSLPIYTIYATGVLLNNSLTLPPFNLLPDQMLGKSHQSSPLSLSFEEAIIISRFYSALFSLFLIPLIFFLGNMLHSKKAGILAAVMATLNVGLIQFAHFGTFELWLTFFTTLLFFCFLSYYKKPTTLLVLPLGILSGGLVAVKISHLVLLPLTPILIFITRFLKEKMSKKWLATTLSDNFIFLSTLILIYIATNPYAFLDPSFISSMRYESSVALGTLSVFYTGEFFNTIPLLYQFLHIYPFLLNPLITFIFIPSFIYLTYLTIKRKHIPYLILITLFLILLLSQAFIFAKWTRYMLPTVPFILLISSIAIANFLEHFKKAFSIQCFVVSVFLIINIAFATSYFITVFVEKDTRIAAAEFSKTHLSANTQILSEIYDLGITPFNNSFPKITLFNFYDLDNNSLESNDQTLNNLLATTNYIILPSQRLLKTRLDNPQEFPKGYAYYQRLSTEKLGYKKIYQTPCDLFCEIIYLGNPILSFEGTANIFDRPTVMIFEKQ